MKNARTYALCLFTFLMAAAPAAAQHTASVHYPPLTGKVIERVKKNFAMGLQSGNDGVIESTLMLVGQMRMRYPESIMEEQQRLVEQLAVSHPSERIRYKAYLITALCSDVEWFSGDPKVMAASSDQFFSTVAQRLNMKYFGFNSK